MTTTASEWGCGCCGDISVAEGSNSMSICFCCDQACVSGEDDGTQISGSVPASEMGIGCCTPISSAASSGGSEESAAVPEVLPHLDMLSAVACSIQ